MLESCCIILTTTNAQNIVEQITSTLIKENLAACVQVDNVVSHFKWQDKISSEPEFRIVIKAKSANYDKIEKIIISLHNYDIPQIIKLDIQDGLPAYLNWIIQNV